MTKKSWKTTVAGILTIILAVGAAVKALVDGDPATNPDLEFLIAQVVLGIGMLSAKDAAVTGGTVPATAEAEKRVG